MLTVALLQIQSFGQDQAANLEKGETFCRRAATMGADIALFPEMWNVGYTYCRIQETGAPDPARDPLGSDLWRSPEYWPAGATSALEGEREAVERFHRQAVGRDGAFVTHFRRLARELGMAIALTYLERWQPLPRNTMSLIDRHGEIVLTYAKVHTCDFDLPEGALTPGDGLHVCALDSAGGAVQVGAMICYDREFPESARVLMLQGAEIILVPNASDMEINRLCQIRTRAFENMVGLAVANYPGPGLGHSSAYDGIAFAKGRSRDMLIVEAGEGEGIFLAPFDLEALREYRRRESWGNAFRKPHRYGLLTSAEVAEPFVRVDETGKRYHQARRQA